MSGSATRLFALLLLSTVCALAADEKMPVAEAVATLRRLYNSGARAEAEALLTRLATQAKGDAEYCFSVGMTLGAVGQVPRAEEFLSLAAAAAPSDYRILYNLGVAASLLDHLDRAAEVLATALKLQPQNVDVLYNLAYVNEKLGRREETLRLLARAAKLAPQRADVVKLMAIAAFELRAWDDALAAWDRYRKLQPGDDVARRERGFTAVQIGQFEQGVADLKWFLDRHPDDPEGHHELGLAQVDLDPEQALAHLSRAIALQPDFAEARSNRGSLLYQQGKPEEALPDLEFAASRRPDDAITLDRLGQTYSALDRPTDAVRVLRRAARLAPEDSRTLLHLGRALADAGETAESKTVMDRFRQLGPVKNPPVPKGLIDYLSLSPEQQRADYRARVERAVAKDPNDGPAQVRYLRLLLEDGKLEQARPLLEKAALTLPGDREILLLRATTLELTGKPAGAEQGVKQILDRWPEWHAGWVAQGVLLATRKRYAEARQAFEKAVSLGAHSPETRSYLAATARQTAPEEAEPAASPFRDRLFRLKSPADW